MASSFRRDRARLLRRDIMLRKRPRRDDGVPGRAGFARMRAGFAPPIIRCSFNQEKSR
jgi:hypothetical protein